MQTILSGIQPSGELHLGNYFGAISENLRVNADENKALYFIADYHALTSLRDPKLLKSYTYDVAATYLALGLQRNALIFRQSDVPQTTELAWILSTTTGLGVLNRAPAYKEKVEKGLSATVGLFSYPMLMAADILLFGSDIVNVGQDQLPHIEIARSVASSFNAQYGNILKIPKASLTTAPKVLGTDGQKMSKSYKNTIPIFDDPEKISKIIKTIKTSGVDFTKDPMPIEGDVVFSLYALFANPTELEEMRDNYTYNRNFGYGQAKARLIEKVAERFGAAYFKYQEIRADEYWLDERLSVDAALADAIAFDTLKRVREAVGLPEPKQLKRN